MVRDFFKLRKEIPLLSCKDNIISVLIYGTAITEEEIVNDLDVIIIVKRVESSLNSLFFLLSSEYEKLDFNVYSYDEVSNDLSFFTREFKLEYLSKGLCIYGSNLFQSEFGKVSKSKYRRSIVIRSIEHLQMVRQKYFSQYYSPEQKLKYMKKYFLRISKNILLFRGVDDHVSVSNMNQSEVIKKLVELRIFDVLPDLDGTKDLNEYFNLFQMISEALVKCRKELGHSS